MIRIIDENDYYLQYFFLKKMKFLFKTLNVDEILNLLLYLRDLLP